MTEYFKIGKFVASTGLEGKLVLQHSLGKKTALKNLKAVFIEDKKNSFLPYFIEDAQVRSNTEVVIKLEGINKVESARRLTPKEVWLTEADFKLHAAKSAPISLLGFHIIDGDIDRGEIIEVIEQPHQVLCAIMYKGKEALVPVHEGSLQKIDNRNKKIYLEIPEGLLDIYG